MSAIKTILKEQYENIYLIHRLSLYELKQAYAGNLLGVLWVFESNYPNRCILANIWLRN